MFAYLKNAEWSVAAVGVACEGMLLYPAVGAAVAAEFELSGTRLRIRSIDLDQDWPRIHHDLLDLVGTG